MGDVVEWQIEGEFLSSSKRMMSFKPSRPSSAPASHIALMLMPWNACPPRGCALGWGAAALAALSWSV